MPDLLPPSVAISIATATVAKPPSLADGKDYRFLVGIALFEAEEVTPGAFTHRLQVTTIEAGASETELLERLASCLPADRIAIGWHLAQEIVPVLLEAAGDVHPPAVAGKFLDALARTVTLEAVDLADQQGGVAAPPLAEVCAEEGIPARFMSEAELLDAWGLGRRIELVDLLATNAVAAWRLWALTLRPGDVAPQRFARDALARWRVADEVVLSWCDDGYRDDQSQ